MYSIPLKTEKICCKTQTSPLLYVHTQFNSFSTLKFVLPHAHKLILLIQFIILNNFLAPLSNNAISDAFFNSLSEIVFIFLITKMLQID